MWSGVEYSIVYSSIVMCSSGFSEYNIVLFFYQDNLTTYLLFYSFFFTCKTSTQKTCVTISPTFFLSTYINIDNQTGIIIFILHYTQSGLSYRVDKNVTRKKGLPKTYIGMKCCFTGNISNQLLQNLNTERDWVTF